MPLAIVVTLESDLPAASTAYAKAASGKALAREAERLDAVARRCGVESITAYLSERQADLIAQLRDDGFDPEKMRLPPERWFPAADGLNLVAPVVAHIAANPNDVKQPNPILRDLRATEALLRAADAAGVRFHFSKAVV